MSKRLLLLQKMTREGSKDPFHWYALALEHAALDQQAEALATFEALREIDPGYVPMYLMCGTMLGKAGDFEKAEAWLTQGIDVARAKGDQHALGELEEALEGIRDVTQH